MDDLPGRGWAVARLFSVLGVFAVWGRVLESVHWTGRGGLSRWIAVFHEHSRWNAPLFDELDRRGFKWSPIDASSSEFDPTVVDDWDVVVNRMSPSAWIRGHGGR